MQVGRADCGYQPCTADATVTAVLLVHERLRRVAQWRCRVNGCRDRVSLALTGSRRARLWAVLYQNCWWSGVAAEYHES